jgi:hypothetical protein
VSLLAGLVVTSLIATSAHATAMPTQPADNYPVRNVRNVQNGWLNKLPGFFHFSFDDVKMPNGIQHMGMLGVNYLADLTPYIYGGVGAYGAVTGTQGGLFTLGLEAGVHHELAANWWGEAGLFAGGGGGKSSLVGGGIMLRPSIGIAYSLKWARLGLHYSYVDFPDGDIHSQQMGLDLDIPTDFYYLFPSDIFPGDNRGCRVFNLANFPLPEGQYLNFQRNDFAILLQSYRQRPGTQDSDGGIQDGAIWLLGAELDHYFTDNTFWWLKAAGAFSGIPNGYMDVLGGLGYHWSTGLSGIALVPQFGIGAGGGGMVDTGGGFLMNPQLGVELPLTSDFAMRLSSGYIWSPKGRFKAVPITGEILYHLNVATGSDHPVGHLVSSLASSYEIQGWRIQVLNQTYFHPQRIAHATRSPINLIGVQIDQLFTPFFFLSYQGAAAYSGFHAGGYATGMIGPGLQSPVFFNGHMQAYAAVFVGAGGGGGLSLSGGSLIEPVAGLRYAFTPIIGLQVGISDVKALRDDLNTPVLNVGVTIRFDTLNRV